MIDRPIRIGETVATWTSPGQIGPAKVIHSFVYEGRPVYVVETRREPAPSILHAREPGQLFEPDAGSSGACRYVHC